MAAVKIGKALGARVVAAASTPEKRALCLESGADEVIDYTNHDLKQGIKALTGGRGADVVYDPVGGAYTEQALRATAWNGRFLVVGWASGHIPKVPTNLVLLKGCALIGVFWGAHAFRERDALLASFDRLFQMHRDGHIVPHIARIYPLEEGGAAIGAIGARQVLGKVLVDVASETTI